MIRLRTKGGKGKGIYLFKETVKPTAILQVRSDNSEEQNRTEGS